MSIFENFTVRKICFHEIFKRAARDQELAPRLTEGVFNLELPAKQYLSERLVKALGEDSHGILMHVKSGEAGRQGAFPFVHTCFQSSDDGVLLNCSKELAKKLSSLQTRTNIPGGIILVLDGTTGIAGRRFVCIIKAELHAGFTKRIQGNTITIEFARELFLTPEQRLFKIGIYIQKESHTYADTDPSEDQYDILVFDSQMSKANPAGAAHYFCDGFLGCEMPKDNNVLTKLFYDETKHWIFKSDLTEKQKYDFSLSLYSYVKHRQQSTLRTSEFSEQYLPMHARDSYIAHMHNVGMPSRAVHKDLRLLGTTFDRKRIRFDSGLSVSGSPEAFRKKVEIGALQDDGTHIVTIRDEIDIQQ